MHSLPVFLRLRGAPVILVGAGAAADAKRRLLERAGAIVVGEEAPARLALVALGAGADADDAAARLKARGLLVNVADRPDLCDFTLPAIVDRDPVIVAIGTGGASAGLAAALRQRLESLLPAGLGALAETARAAREDLAARFPDPGDRRRALAALMAPGGALDPLGERHDPLPPAGVPAGAAPAAPRLERIMLASADPDDLTLRAARLLGRADRLYHNGDVPAAILDRARADAERIAGRAPASPPPGLSIELGWDRR